MHNRIEKIGELEQNTELRLLELGDNRIDKIENIGHLTKVTNFCLLMKNTYDLLL